MVQTEKFEHFIPTFEGAGAQNGYKREIPNKYTEMRDDRLMNSLIKTYALESKDDNGKSTGNFFFDKAAAEAVSSEVVHTHRDLSGNQLKGFLDEHFETTWEHFDVNNDNLVEVERMP